jgi:nitrite reductase/ring-hydroxylating ferredoxin subunit
MFSKVCKIEEVPEESGKKFELEDGTEIAVFKVGNKFHAVINRCPHNQTKLLHEGKVSDELYLECPVHGWRFNLETGITHPDCQELGSKLEIFETKVEDGELYIEVKKNKFKWSEEGLNAD